MQLNSHYSQHSLVAVVFLNESSIGFVSKIGFLCPSSNGQLTTIKNEDALFLHCLTVDRLCRTDRVQNQLILIQVDHLEPD